MENYAVKGGQEKSIAPNAMWTKRPYGQLAKCAEAQALRKAFPEIASQPTADEMEGKTLHQERRAVAAIMPEPPPELLKASEEAAAPTRELPPTKSGGRKPARTTACCWRRATTSASASAAAVDARARWKAIRCRPSSRAFVAEMG
jgi:hypothetical protein